MTSLELVTTIISAAGGSAVIVAALAAFLGKLWMDRITQAQKQLQDIDVDLRKRRLDVYPQLWKSTALLPMWPKASGVTYEQLMHFSESLRTWYFEVGGMYLSRSTHRDAYTPLQKALKALLESHPSGLISDAHYESIRLYCSGLRTALAGDIESRREGVE
jgi:hypothetical protein